MSNTAILPQIQPITNPLIINIAAQRFGRTTVIGYVGKYHAGGSQWLCLCDCGKQHVARGMNLRNGTTSSCGCLRSDMSSDLAATHHMRKSPEYYIWTSMKQRCMNPNAKDYPHYGQRGIKVCVGWQFFENFYADMQSRPSPKYSIDRRDVHGHYSCGHCDECVRSGWINNCHWATVAEQANNRTDNRILDFNGESMTAKQWSIRLGINHKLILRRLFSGWSTDRALTEPVHAEKVTRARRPF